MKICERHHFHSDMNLVCPMCEEKELLNSNLKVEKPQGELDGEAAKLYAVRTQNYNSVIYVQVLKAFLAGIAYGRANPVKLTEKIILETIHEWQHYWMDQTQNSEADRRSYFSRALSVDANMKHSLAKMILKKFEESKS